MEENGQDLFRKKAIESISSPEELTTYLRVTSPGIWVILCAVIVLLAGMMAWASVGTLETTVEAKVIVKDQQAEVIPTVPGRLEEGMTLRVSSQEVLLSGTGEDEYGRAAGMAEIPLPDGSYDGVVVTDRTKPIDFLLQSR